VKIKKLIGTLIYPFVLVNTYGQVSDIHSHNDYLRKVPFWEAAAANARSIEVDVILLRDTLFVGHEKESIKSGWTFEDLYLEPIRQSALFGFSLHPQLQLLVDSKTEAISTLALIIEKCEAYKDFLYQPETGKGVKIIVSGNRPAPAFYHQSPPYLFFDHQNMDDLSEISLEKVGMVSLPFYKFIRWNGRDRIAETEREKILNITQTAHNKMVPFRFWATPDTAEAWSLLPELGVDFINTDKPTALALFLKSGTK
jgi:alkaline phosphatase